MQDFSEYGTYEIHIGNDHGDQHDLLVAFGKPATVDITVVTTHDGAYGSGEDEMIIEEVTTPAAVAPAAAAARSGVVVPTVAVDATAAGEGRCADGCCG